MMFRYVTARRPRAADVARHRRHGHVVRRLRVHDPAGLLGHARSRGPRRQRPIVAISGHMHDVDITGPGPVHQPLRRGGQRHRRLGRAGRRPGDRLLRARIRRPQRSHSPPADITGATMCRSEGYYGTAVRRARSGRATSTPSACAGSQPTSRPAPSRRPIPPAAHGRRRTATRSAPGQVIKLHSEYQNDTGSPQTDAMGIMVGYLSRRPSRATRGPRRRRRSYFPLVPAYNQCSAAPNRVARARAAQLRPRATRPLDLGPADGRQPGRERARRRTSSGSAKFACWRATPRPPRTRRTCTSPSTSTDVRKKSDLTDYTGQLQVTSGIADHRPQQRARRGRDRARGLPGDRAVHRDGPTAPRSAAPAR